MRIVPVYVKTIFMVADIFTKALSYMLHARHTMAIKGQTLPEKEKKGKRSKRKAASEEDAMET